MYILFIFFGRGSLLNTTQYIQNTKAK